MVQASSGNNNVRVGATSNKPINAVETSNSKAEFWANKAQEYATSDNIIDGEDYSAKFYANKAEENKNASDRILQQVGVASQEAQEDIELVKEGAISAIREEGETQRATIQGDVDTAVQKAQEAQDSALQAQTSATNAQNSETNAETYAGNASESASSASSSATNALTSANNAQASALSAQDFATSAQSSAQNASTNAQKALNYSNSANQYATNAQNFANSASSSASSASSSAELAQQYAQEAQEAVTSGITPATSSKIGGVIIKDNLSVDVNGNLSADVGIDDIPTKTSDLQNDSGFLSSNDTVKVRKITKEDYSALATKDPNTLYVITTQFLIWGTSLFGNGLWSLGND